MVEHWSTHHTVGFGMEHFLLRARTDWDEGFVLMPCGTLEGKNTCGHTGEHEIMHVSVEKPVPAEIVRETIRGVATALKNTQLDAYHLARPAYDAGYLKGTAPVLSNVGRNRVQARHPAYDFDAAADALQAHTSYRGNEGLDLITTAKRLRLPAKKPRPEQPVVTFLMGLPAAGKSTWIAEHYGTDRKAELINADVFKEVHRDFDPERAEVLHPWSMKYVYKLIDEALDHPRPSRHVIIDGTGSRAQEIAEQMARARARGYHVELRVIAVPFEVAMQRLAGRTRKVPAEIMHAKAKEIGESFRMTAPLADNVLVIDNSARALPSEIATPDWGAVARAYAQARKLARAEGVSARANPAGMRLYTTAPSIMSSAGVPSRDAGAAPGHPIALYVP